MRLKLNHLASAGLIHNHFYLSARQCLSLVLGLVMLATLACSLLDGASPGKSRPVVIRQVLPTLTPTVNPGPNSAAPTALIPENTAPPLSPTTSPALPPVETPSILEQPSSTPLEANPQPAPNGPASIALDPNVAPVATPAPSSANWTFAGVQVYPDEFETGLALYGDVINETGSTQELNIIRATFYDGQGQVIADASSAIDYWPIDVIPAGARLPFGILAPEIKNAANFELNVEAQPGAQLPHQNFQVSGLNQQQAEFGYCLTGQVQNTGSPLQEYLVVMAVLYDNQNHVIKFGEYYAPDPTVIVGDQLEPFEICVDSVSREVARHEVRVWGE